MEWWVLAAGLALIAVGAGSVAVAVVRLAPRGLGLDARVTRFRGVARELGLAPVPHALRAIGWVDEREVELAVLTSGVWRLRAHGVHPGLRIRAGRGGGDLPDLEVEGPEHVVLASLGWRARERLRAFAAHHQMVVADGWVELQSLRPGAIYEELHPLLREVVGLARDLGAGDDLDARLLDNLVHEPVAERRQAMLELARRRGPDVALRAASAVASARDPATRALAASILEDRASLWGIVEFPGRAEPRLQALQKLLELRQDPGRLAALATRLLGSNDDGLRLEALRVLVALGRDPGDALLERWVPALHGRPREVQDQAAAGLVLLEPFLADRERGWLAVVQLASSRRGAALAWLEREGSARAVPVLSAVARDAVAPEASRKRAAKVAVAVARRVGVDAGALSLADATGELSLTGAGKLSLAQGVQDGSTLAR